MITGMCKIKNAVANQIKLTERRRTNSITHKIWEQKSLVNLGRYVPVWGPCICRHFQKDRPCLHPQITPLGSLPAPSGRSYWAGSPAQTHSLLHLKQTKKKQFSLTPFIIYQQTWSFCMWLIKFPMKSLSEGSVRLLKKKPCQNFLYLMLVDGLLLFTFTGKLVKQSRKKCSHL